MISRILLVGIFMLMLVMPAMGAGNTNFDVKQGTTVLGAGDNVTIGVPIIINVTYGNWDPGTKNYSIGIGDTYYPIDNELTSGTFTDGVYYVFGTTYTPNVAGKFYVISQCSLGTDSGIIDFDLHAQQQNAVPEPATIAMTLMGMLAIIGFVWSRKEE